MFSDKLTKSIALAVSQVIEEGRKKSSVIESHDTKDAALVSVGSELRVHGKWCVVDEISGNTAWCSDEDGEDIEVDLSGSSWDLLEEAPGRRQHRSRRDEPKISVGTELRVHGKWCVVDEISGNTAWCSDEDGEDIEVDLLTYDWDQLSETAGKDAATAEAEIEEIPKVRDWNYIPKVKDWNHIPKVKDWNHIPKVKDWNQIPKVKDWNQIPKVKDWNYIPKVRDSDQLSETAGEIPDINQRIRAPIEDPYHLNRNVKFFRTSGEESRGYISQKMPDGKVKVRFQTSDGAWNTKVMETSALNIEDSTIRRTAAPKAEPTPAAPPAISTKPTTGAMIKGSAGEIEEGVEEPHAGGEKNFKAAHPILKNSAVHEADQSGTGAMAAGKPKLPVGTKFSKGEDVDGEKIDLANIAAIKSSSKNAPRPAAAGKPAIVEIDGEKVADKTISAIKNSTPFRTTTPKATGSKQSGAQSAEKVPNTAPSGKLSADEPKAKQRFSEPMAKGLKEAALVALLGEDAPLSTFDKKFASNNEKALKQLLAGLGTDGIDVKELPLLNSFIATYGDELKVHFKIAVIPAPVKESVTSVNKTKGAELADHIVEAAERVAGLISRRIESDPPTLSELNKIDRTLSDIAYQLDESKMKDAAIDQMNSEFMKNSVNNTKGAELADHIVEAAERVAGLISRRIESDPMTLSKLDKIDRTLSDIAYQLDMQIPSRFKSTAG